METADWSATVESWTAAAAEGFVELLPRLVMALVLLVAGWLIGRVLRWLITRAITRIGRLRTGRAVERAVEETGAERVASEVIGRIVFWTVFVFFAAMAGEVLGVAVASSGLAALLRYLPSVLAAVVVLVAGLVLANLARDAVRALFARTGVSGRLPGEMARTTVILLAAVIALDQIGIDSTLLIIAVAIVLAAVAGSVALAVGLGARHEMSNIISLHYLTRSYGPGQRVRIGDVEGRIVELRMNGVIIDTESGRTLVPAREFGQQVSRLVGEAG